MTAVQNVPLIVLDSGGPNEMTVNTESCKENVTKKLYVKTPPQATSNWSNGPKTTWIIDYLLIEKRFTVIGTIEPEDKTKFRNLMNKGGVFDMLWDGVTYTVNMDKYDLDMDSKSENSEVSVTFTVVVGVNQGGN